MLFDLAWSEIALIAVVALVVIGPKDLPGAIRGAADGIKKLRRMAGEFQQQADELVKEAKLDELRNQIADVRSTISDIKNFDLKGEIEKTVDKDGSLRQGLSDPLVPSSTTYGTPVDGAAAPAPAAEEAPAFVPPSVAASYKPPPPPPPPVEAPDFVPPSYAPPPAATPAPVTSKPPAPSQAAAAPLPPSA